MNIDDTIGIRLNSIGPFTTELVTSLETELTWEAPAALANDLASLELRFRIEADRDEVDINVPLSEILLIWERVCAQFASRVPEFRSLLMEHFDRHATDEDDFDDGLDDGFVQLTWCDGHIQTVAHFFVEWDEEHGAEIELRDDGSLSFV